MLTFTGQQQQCKDLAQDSSTAAVTFFKTNLNIGQRILETELGSFFTEEQSTVTTVASTATYDLPADFLRLKKAYVTIGNTRYEIEEVYDEEEWQYYQYSQSNTQDILQKIFVRRDTFEVYPIPSSAGNVITLIHEATGKQLTAEDYTTGSIQTITAADETVIGTGTTFTTAMAGRFLKVTNDGVWYKIASYTSATELEIEKAYEGLTVSGGSEAYIIGEMPRTPSATHHIPVYYALMQYFNGFKQSKTKGRYYRELFEVDMARAKETYGRRYSSMYIPSRRHRLQRPINPNHYPPTMSSS